MSKADASKRVVEMIRKKFGSESALLLGEGSRCEVTEVIPTGLDALDRHVIGVGGLAVGRIHEVFGPESGGKSGFVYQCLGRAQKEGGLGIICETEDSLTVERASLYGVDNDNLLVLQPDYMEMATAQMMELLEGIPDNVGPNLLAWDSLAATQTKQEYEDGADAGAEMGERARHMSRVCRQLLPLARRKRTAVIIVNQTRQKIGIAFGNPETTPGGNAVKFFASVRLRIGAGEPIKVGGVEVGKFASFKAVKNKLTAPHRDIKVKLIYDKGWDNMWTTIAHAKDMGVIKEDAKVVDKTYHEARAALGWPSDKTIDATENSK